jgi:hypothetical protein
MTVKKNPRTIHKHMYITSEDLQTEMAKLRETLDRWRAPIQSEQDMQHKTLYGNGDGEIGMDEHIRNIYGILNTLIRLAWIVVGATVTIAAGGIVSAIVYLIRATGK